MRILLVAYACHPKWGSESGAGWNLAVLLAQKYTVHVVTHTENREGIQKSAYKKLSGNRLSFSFLGDPFVNHPNRLIARIMSWFHYLRWLRKIAPDLKNIVQKENPDLIHHATYATWRFGIPWYRMRVPVIWGPLGGAAFFPAKFLQGLSLFGVVFEIFRNLGTLMGRFRPDVMQSCRRVAAILCGNGPDAEFIKKIRGSGTGVYVLSSAHFSPQELERFQTAGGNKDFHAPLQAFAGGICIGSKGIRFALEALAVARQMGSRIQYTIASTGPELRHLQKSVMQLGLADQVRFHAGFHGRAYEEALGKSHLFLMPSFREGSPRTILEAMLAGAVPVVCAASAQGEIVDEKVGFSVSIRSRTELVQGMADAMVRLDRNRRLLQAMSKQAQMKIVRDYNSKRFFDRLSEIYHLAKAGHPPGARTGWQGWALQF